MNAIIRNTITVETLLEEYGATKSTKVLYEILDKVLKSKLETYIYDKIYSYEGLLFKNLAIKCAPESWLRSKMMLEDNTHLVGVMIERSDREKIKYNANELIHAKNWQVRLYAAEKADNKREIIKQLMVEGNSLVVNKLFRRV